MQTHPTNWPVLGYGTQGGCPVLGYTVSGFKGHQLAGFRVRKEIPFKEIQKRISKTGCSFRKRTKTFSYPLTRASAATQNGSLNTSWEKFSMGTLLSVTKPSGSLNTPSGELTMDTLKQNRL
jgi:hypothetical protein